MSKSLFVVRYKRSSNMVEEARCSAETLETAQQAAAVWCQRQATGLAPVRLINVRPFVEFDAEELLAPPPVPVAAEKVPAAEPPPPLTSFGQKLKQSLGA